jgi:acyl-coenzyme A thioesterase PaaI-like protein
MLPSWYQQIPPRLRPLFLRYGLNWFPAFRATGGRVTHVARDLRSLTLELPLTRRTRNGAGTLFGGSLYAVTDPIYAVLLALHLGRDYIVWDKAGAIRYRRPGRTTLTAEFRVDEAQLAAIRQAVAADGETEVTLGVELRDADGRPHVEVDKTIYIADKTFYKRRNT